jgi:hypothetical protein
MKKSEIRRLVSEYSSLKSKYRKTNDQKISQRMAQLRHHYYHETGREFESDLRQD